MNPEVKTKWIEALRSGKYAQGSGHLCDLINHSPGYCCYGVLAELYLAAHPNAQREEVLFVMDEDDETGEPILKVREYPTKAVLDWAGLKYEPTYDPDNKVTINKLEAELSNHNDGRGIAHSTHEILVPKSDFNAIATAIEEQL